jgi:hypothetical protein
MTNLFRMNCIFLIHEDQDWQSGVLHVIKDSEGSIEEMMAN